MLYIIIILGRKVMLYIIIILALKVNGFGGNT